MQWMGADLQHWLVIILLAILVVRDALGRQYTYRVVKKNNEARDHIKKELAEIKALLKGDEKE